MEAQMQYVQDYTDYIKCGEILKAPVLNFQEAVVLKCFQCKDVHFLLESFIAHIQEHFKDTLSLGDQNAKTQYENTHLEEMESEGVGIDNIAIKLEELEDPLFPIKCEADEAMEFNEKCDIDERTSERSATSIKGFDRELLDEFEYICDSADEFQADDSETDEDELKKRLKNKRKVNAKDEHKFNSSETDEEELTKVPSNKRRIKLSPFVEDFMKCKNNVLTLIELYKNQPDLWNKYSPFYRLRDKRKQFFEEITQNLNNKCTLQLTWNQTAEVISHICGKHRDDFKRIQGQQAIKKKGNKSSNRQGKVEKKLDKQIKCCWFFDELNFLRSKVVVSLQNFDSNLPELTSEQIIKILEIYQGLPHLWNTYLIENICSNKRRDALTEMIKVLDAKKNYTRLSSEAKIEEDLRGEVAVPPARKLEDLIHLAELCVDLQQQNEEHYAEAFAWFSDLLVEHAEIFWSLFAVDMDRVLSEQPPDTWDSFPLFQILNDYLRADDNLRNGRFHQHLRDTFAPLVVRYVDLMESSIAQSINKGFEKERWESKGNGCATSEDLFWKLDALQSFIRDLHWPEPEFRQHLEQRLKMMAAEMIEQCIARTDASFQSWLKKNIAFISSTDYIVPSEMCAMVNVILNAKNQSFKLTTIDGIDLYKFHAKIDDQLDKANVAMTQGLSGKLMSVLESTLSKLARYDEGSLIGSILSFTNVSSSGKDLGQSYVIFFRNNMEQIRGKIGDDLWALNFFEQWYTQQVNMLCNWLSERLDHSLHYAQVQALSNIVKKIYSDFELQGMLEEKLNSKAYQTVATRMATEEATCALTMPDTAEGDETGEDGRDLDGVEEEGAEEETATPRVRMPQPNLVSAQAAAVTNVVAGRVGNLLGKGIGGLSSKLGTGGWF